MIRHYFLSSIRTLRQNPLYTALSVFGIALTFVFVSILFLIVKHGSGDFIPPNYTKRTWMINQYNQIDHEGNWNWHAVSKENYETSIQQMKTPEIIVATTWVQLENTVHNGQSFSFALLGVNDNYYDVCRFKFLRGRPLNKQEIAEALPVAVVDRTTAISYFGKNEDPIGKTIEMRGTDFRVVGVVENTTMFSMDFEIGFANIWVPIGAAKSSNYSIYLTAKDKTDVSEMQAEFIRILEETGAVNETQYVINDYQSLEEKNSLFNAVGLIIGLFILMLIPALNILSLNISKSLDRCEEIAVRKAFGAPRRTIFGQLLIENTLITLVGAVIGMCITPPLLNVIDKMILELSAIPVILSLHFDWTTILLVAFPCVLLFSFLSGSIPAWITAKREIVNVLKGETLTIGLVRNRRRSLVWIVIEQALVFAVLLFCFTFFVDDIVNRFKKGIVSVENIISINFSGYEIQEDEREAYSAQFLNMVKRMEEWESVESVSVNFYASPIGNSIWRDSIGFGENYYRANIKRCDENYYRMFSPRLSEGQWFRDVDAALETAPALVTQRLANEMGMTGSAVGQTIAYSGRTYRITGVVETLKHQTTGEQLAALFIPFSTEANTRLEYFVKYRHGMGTDFSKAFIAEFYRNFPRDKFQPVLLDLSKLRNQQSFMSFSLKFYLFGIPVVFLLIFAFMGTFGVIWVQSKKRMSEFGLRIAFGCTPMRLMRKIIFENLALTTIAMLPGLIVVALLFAYAPRGWEWTAAVGAAVVFMWLFSVVSAWYPAWKAAKVQPVEALKASQ